MFGKYDIRGKYPSEVNEENFSKAGTAIKKMMKEFKIKDFVVASDYRKSGKSLIDSLCSAPNSIFVGPMPTPCIQYRADFVGIITASHNPPEYNGLKLFLNNGTLPEKYYKKIKNLYQVSKPVKTKKVVLNKKLRKEILENYISDLPNAGNAVFDLGGGAACAVKNLFPKRLFDMPDPTFKKRYPEPKIGTLSVLEKTVKNRIGIAFDGDADRCVVIDKKMIDADVLGGYIVSKNMIDSKNIIMTVDCSSKVFSNLIEQGFNCKYCAVGIKDVEKTMRRFKDSFGFENSGHYYASNRKYVGDGIYFGLLLSNSKPNSILSYQNSLSIERTQLTVKKVNYQTVRDFLEKLGAVEFIELDGVKGITDDWSVLIRNSNTQPLARVSVEAKNKIKLKELEKEIQTALSA
ncbi:hypothetical protein KO465_00105 [Candidatus Micrarchaeota archaeon]|nr:hypothetical protein [Candidatus Micrarchaeota archaeon]